MITWHNPSTAQESGDMSKTPQSTHVPESTGGTQEKSKSPGLLEERENLLEERANLLGSVFI